MNLKVFELLNYVGLPGGTALHYRLSQKHFRDALACTRTAIFLQFERKIGMLRVLVLTGLLIVT